MNSLPPAPKKSEWMAAVGSCDTEQIRQWVKQGHCPPQEAWQKSADHAYSQAGQRLFQALASGPSVPIEFLERATMPHRWSRWGKATWERLLPKAISKEDPQQWEEWLGQAWARARPGRVDYSTPYRWSHQEVLGWLEWGVKRGWMGREKASQWCCRRSLDELLYLRTLGMVYEEQQAIAVQNQEKALECLADHLKKTGGFFTAELEWLRCKMFVAVSKPSWTEKEYFKGLDEDLHRQRFPNLSAPVRPIELSPAPRWLAKSVQWWGPFVATEEQRYDHPLKKAVNDHPESLKAVLSLPGFENARAWFPAQLGLGIGMLDASWWEQHGPALWSAASGSAIAGAWLQHGNVLGTQNVAEAIGVARVVFPQLVEAGVEIPVASLWKELAQRIPISPSLLEWLPLTQEWNWPVEHGVDAWKSAMSTPNYQANEWHWGNLRRGLEEWKAMTGAKVPMGEPFSQACQGYLLCLRAEKLEQAWEASAPQPVSRKKHRM